jgi:hypothetical protein
MTSRQHLPHLPDPAARQHTNSVVAVAAAAAAVAAVAAVAAAAADTRIHRRSLVHLYHEQQ